MPAAKGKPVQAVAAARLLLEHASEVGTSDVALAGDFNSWPSHGAVLALTEGLVPGHAEHPGSEVGDLSLTAPLRSAYAAAHRGQEPLFTRKKNSQSSQFCLDYVFVGGKVRVAGAGFGAGIISGKIKDQGQEADLGTGSSFAYQGKVGLQYEVVKKGNAFVEFKYLGISSYKSDAGNDVSPPNSYGVNVGYRQGF
jgi:hypothetical protein